MLNNQVGSSQQMMVSQPKSPIVSIAPSSQQPMINGTQQLRFTTQPTFVTNNGQFITGAQPAIINNNQVIGEKQNFEVIQYAPRILTHSLDAAPTLHYPFLPDVASMRNSLFTNYRCFDGFVCKNWFAT